MEHDTHRPESQGPVSGGQLPAPALEAGLQGPPQVRACWCSVASAPAIRSTGVAAVCLRNAAKGRGFRPGTQAVSTVLPYSGLSAQPRHWRWISSFWLAETAPPRRSNSAAMPLQPNERPRSTISLHVPLPNFRSHTSMRN